MGTLQEIFWDCFNGLAEKAASHYDVWEAIIINLPYAPVAYTLGSLDYQYAYMSSFADELIDLSVILYQNNRAIGLWPISLCKKGAAYEFVTNQGPVFPPVYVKNVSERIIKKYDSLCLETMHKFYDLVKNKYTIKSTWQTSVSFLSNESIRWGDRGTKAL